MKQYLVDMPEKFIGLIKTELLPEKKIDGTKQDVKKLLEAISETNIKSALLGDLDHFFSNDDSEVKHLCYLYIINFARYGQLEFSNKIWQCLQRDLIDERLVVRSLSVRCLSYIPERCVLELLVTSMPRLLADRSPFVRKNAARAIEKLCANFGSEFNNQQNILLLKDLLADDSPLVCYNAAMKLTHGKQVNASAIRSFYGICLQSEAISFAMTFSLASKLVAILGRCSDWLQISVHESLLTFNPKESVEAEFLVGKLLNSLQSINSGVVISSIRTIMSLLEAVEDKQLKNLAHQKICSILLSFLSATPFEIQFVILDVIHSLLMNRFDNFKSEFTTFFCKADDPIYVKNLKLQILIECCTAQNYEEILAEIVRYAEEDEIKFSQRAVMSISRLGSQLFIARAECLKGLMNVYQRRYNAIRDDIISSICKLLRSTDAGSPYMSLLINELPITKNSETRAEIIWCLASLCENLNHVHAAIKGVSAGYSDESPRVREALLTAAMKIFVRSQGSKSDILNTLISISIENEEEPDVRDRSLMYSRLISYDLKLCRAIVSTKLAHEQLKIYSDGLEHKMSLKGLGYVNSG